MSDKSVIVIGGGLAGLAVALPLADEGFQVTVFEKRALLGGRASSFQDPETGDRVDNCQHVTMRCCTNLEDFYRRIGVLDRIRYFDALTFLDIRNCMSTIRGSSLPAPLHAAPSFLFFRALGLRDKVAIAYGLFRILRARRDEALDRESMADWLLRSRQTQGAVDRFWRPIMVSACNEDLDRISCVHAFKIFRDGFLVHSQAYQMGLPSVSLGDLYSEPAIAYLEQRGARVRMREHIDRINVRGACVESLSLVDGSTVEADYYVSAVPFDLLLKMMPAEAAELPYFGNLRNLEFSPITGVHLWFDRILDVPPAVALLDREMQWIFNKTENYGLDGAGTYLGLVVSSAKRLADTPKEEIVAEALAEVRSCVPSASDAKLVKWKVIKERKATFAPMPGADRWRPSQKSPVANLFVAGDWTQTGWPATMEGAVRSGYRAAEHLLAEEGIGKQLLAPDLAPSPLARLLMRS